MSLPAPICGISWLPIAICCCNTCSRFNVHCRAPGRTTVGDIKCPDSKKLYPLTFTPVFKDYIWGGRNLERFGRVAPCRKAVSLPKAGKSPGTMMEHPLVDNGYWTGKKLTEVHTELGLDLIGHNNTSWALDRRLPLADQNLDRNRPCLCRSILDDDYTAGEQR